MSRWLVDFDSTLANTFVSQVGLVNRRFGKDYTDTDFTEWGLENVLTTEELVFMWGEECFLNEQFQKTCQPLPWVQEKIEALYNNGHAMTVVSDRPQRLYDITKWWLSFHLEPFVGEIPLILTRSPFSKSDQDVRIPTKAQVAYRQGLRTVVEDSPHHSLGLAERTYIDRVYLLNYQNNGHIQHEKIIRVNSWEDIDVAP